MTDGLLDTGAGCWMLDVGNGILDAGIADDEMAARSMLGVENGVGEWTGNKGVTRSMRYMGVRGRHGVLHEASV